MIIAWVSESSRVVTCAPQMCLHANRNPVRKCTPAEATGSRRISKDAYPTELSIGICLVAVKSILRGCAPHLCCFALCGAQARIAHRTPLKRVSKEAHSSGVSASIRLVRARFTLRSCAPHLWFLADCGAQPCTSERTPLKWILMSAHNSRLLNSICLK